MRKLFILISILLLTSCKKEEIQKNEFDLRIETNTGYTYDTSSQWSWEETLISYHSSYGDMDNFCQIYINNRLMEYSPNLKSILFKVKKGDLVFVRSGLSKPNLNPKLSIYIDNQLDFSDSCKSTSSGILNDPGVTTDTFYLDQQHEVVWSKKF